MIRAGVRVHTLDGVDGKVVAIRPNYSGFDQVLVALDGHTYGPGYPGHAYPIGAVWLVEDAPAPAPLPDSAPLAPSWFPTGASREVVVEVVSETDRQRGSCWVTDYSAPGEIERARRINLARRAVTRARKVRRARHSAHSADEQD